MALTFHKNLEYFYEDLAITLNKIPGGYTEFSFTVKGNSTSYTALYKEYVNGAFLQELAQKDRNVSFWQDAFWILKASSKTKSL